MRILKKIWPIIFLLFLSFFSFLPYLSQRFPYTHDGSNHLARFANYKLALKQGQFPPRLAPNLLNGYGYPVFNYNYPLANIISLPFSILGLSYELTFKILVLASLITLFSGSFFWIKKLTNSITVQLFALALLASSPYIVNILYFRGNIGELMAISLLPLLLYLVSYKENHLFLFIISGLFLLSHNLIVFFSLPLILLFLFAYNHHNIPVLKKKIAVGLLSIGSSLWFWLPSLLEKKYTILDGANLSNDFINHFPEINQLFFSPLSFGFSIPGPVDSLSFSIGITQLIVIILTGFYFLDNRRHSKSIIFLLFLVSVILILVQIKHFSNIWSALPLVKYIQFPWRLSAFLPILMIPLSSLIFAKSTNIIKLFLSILLILQLIGISKLKSADYFHYDNLYYDTYAQSSSTLNENLPQAFTFEYFNLASQRGFLSTPQSRHLTEKGIDVWNGSYRQYYLNLDQDEIVIEPTAYFPGWETEIRYQDINHKAEYIDNKIIGGRIAFSLKKGHNYITTRFTQNTWPRLIGNSISIISFVIAFLIFIKPWIKGKKMNLLFQFISIRLLILSIFVLAPIILIYQPSFPYANILLPQFSLPKAIYSHANFDGVHYLTIAQKGYVGTALIQAFFPTYPLMIRLTNLVINNYLISGLIISNLFSLGLFIILYYFSKNILKSQNPNFLPLLYFLWPSSFFFFNFYTESLFLFLCISVFYLAEKKHYALATILTFIASGTRIVGIFLVPALIYKYLSDNNFKISKKDILNLFVITLGAGGLLLYMLYLEINFHDPIYFVTVQSQFGANRELGFVSFFQVIYRYIKIFLTVPIDLRFLTYAQEFFFSIGGLLALIVSYFYNKRFRYILIFSFLSFILPTTTATFSSMPRYLLTSVSVFILLNTFFDQKDYRFKTIFLCVSTIALIINTILFAQGYWVA